MAFKTNAKAAIKAAQNAGTTSVSRPKRNNSATATTSREVTTPPQAEPAQPQTRAQVVQAAQAESTQSQQPQPTQVPATQTTQAPPEKLSTLAECIPSEAMNDDELVLYISSPFGLAKDVANLYGGSAKAVSPLFDAFLRRSCNERSASQGEAFDDVRKLFFDADDKAFQSLVDLEQYGNASSMHMEYVRVHLDENGEVDLNKNRVVKVKAQLSEDELKAYKGLYGIK